MPRQSHFYLYDDGVHRTPKSPVYQGGQLPTATPNQVKDPVCGMTIRPQDAGGSSEFNGQTVYFCSKGCKQAFDANPAKYAGQLSGARGG
jgi:YHS domain-containing protein